MNTEQFQLVLQSAWAALPTLLAATPVTLGFALGAMLLGLPLGLLVALARLSPFAALRGLSSLFVSFMRGTPLLVQIFVIYYGLPSLGITLNPVMGGVIALTLNAAAYLSETIRPPFSAFPRASARRRPAWA